MAGHKGRFDILQLEVAHSSLTLLKTGEGSWPSPAHLSFLKYFWYPHMQVALRLWERDRWFSYPYGFGKNPPKTNGICSVWYALSGWTTGKYVQ